MEKEQETVQENVGKEQTLVELLNSNPKLQSEFDKLNAKSNETAISKAKEVWVKEEEAKRTEAERLAQMTADEKHKFELSEVSKERDKAISELNTYRLREEAIKIAKSEDIDTGLIDLIDFKNENAESVKTKLQTLSEMYKKSLETAINNSFKEKTPVTKVGSTPTPKSARLESF